MTETKPLTRLFTESPLGIDVPCALPDQAAHKLRAVLRAKPGDEIIVFNGRDGAWRATLDKVGKIAATATCHVQIAPQRPEPGPWLAFAPVKKDRMDTIIEKAVELGVEHLIPVTTRHTQTRRIKIDRLRQQIVDAAEQCERLTVPTLGEPVSLDRLGDVWPGERTLLICAERLGVTPLGEALTMGHGPWGVLVGPEGGFDYHELDAALKIPLSRHISLGPRVLRAETAAIAALAVIQAVVGDWSRDNA